MGAEWEGTRLSITDFAPTECKNLSENRDPAPVESVPEGKREYSVGHISTYIFRANMVLLGRY
jgi:hypothetical protein